ncbi:MAG: DUF5011 domain-containing protein, partial [Thaumarchaeota archaeon]
GYSTFSGRPIQAEYVDTTSVLVGKYIDTISVKLERTGSPAGTIQAGVFNSDQSVKRLFGSMDVLAVSAGSYTQYTFSLSSPQTYQIQPGERIGIKFADGDASNYISIMTDQTNAFDGINSYLTYFTNIWQPLTTQDYFMTLSLTHFTAPVITINGANPLVLAKGMTYLEPGAKAIDAADGNLTGSIITASNVNTGTIGTYTVNYTVTNSHSFSSKATRTVSVTADTTPPVITIRGTNPVAIKLNSAYVDAGATAIDNVDGNVTSSITTQNNVNRGQVGSYTVTYTVSDKAGNTAQAVRNVSVRDDNTAPVITARGSNPLTVGHGAVYIDPGATAIDNVDGNVTSSITTQNNVNTGIIGTYTVTYNVSDKVGNAATQVTRTVNVVDVTPITAMNDTTNTYGYAAFSGRPIEAEYVTDKSILVGKSIDTIVLTMQAEGAPSGTVQVGVFNDDLSVKQLFGTMDAANVTVGSYTQYAFSLPAFSVYQIQPGDRIGVKFAGGDTSNLIDVMTDQSNTFDGKHSYLTYYAGVWLSFEDQADLTLVLQQAVIPTDLPIVTPPGNIISVTTNSSRNIPSLGTPAAVDKSGSSPAISNNSTGVFNIGNTTVTWRAVDSVGNIGVAYQKIAVISANTPTIQVNRVAMIDFDDGYDSIYFLGKPVLDKYNVKTTQYIVCNYVNVPGYMTLSEILAMQAQGHNMQSHTMNHLHANHFSQSQLDFEYGQAKPCLTNDGLTNVHMVAIPFQEGYNNATVINTILKYYDMSRGGTGTTFLLHCSGPASTQSDCRTLDSHGNLNQYTRYNIRDWSQDAAGGLFDYHDSQTFAQFIQVVNAATTNTDSNSTEVPIVVYHRMVNSNGGLDPALKGTTVTLLDAEMKYLRDNNFKIWSGKDLAYDPVKNWFYFKAS